MQQRNIFGDDALQWFALSAVYGRELKVLEKLKVLNVEAFVPMHYIVRESATRRRKRMLVPVVNNWIFVHASKSWIDNFKRQLMVQEGWKLCYLTRIVRVAAMVGCDIDAKPKEIEKQQIITIPEQEMQRFIDFCVSISDDLHFYRPEEVNLSQGDRVRIIGGDFNGMEGYFVKLQGKRNRRFIIELPHMLLAATASIQPEFIEVLEKSSKKLNPKQP